MKYLLLAAGILLALGGCVSSITQGDSDPVHVAVIGYLQKGLANPARYRPVHWGQERPFRQREADSLFSKVLVHNPPPADSLKSFPRYPAKERIGTMVRHIYQIKDSAGVIRLDSALYIVAKTGEVVAL